MGNTPAKQNDDYHDYSRRVLDEENDRPMYVNPKVPCVFNFYGAYSRDEFLRAGVDDPEFEKKVMDDVDWTVRSFKGFGHISVLHYTYHKGVRYGIAVFNMAYIAPLCSITLGDVHILRFLGTNTLKILFPDSKKVVKWQYDNPDLTARFVLDLVEQQGLRIKTIQNDFGMKTVIVSDCDDLRTSLSNIIACMMCVVI